MGSWTITINGHGQHDNGQPEDIETLAAGVVAELKAIGHTVEHASVTIGSGRFIVDKTDEPDDTGFRYF